MNNFRQYEDAIAMYHNGLNIKKAPVYCWDFHSDFLAAVKNFFLDLNKLNSIASQNKWIQNNWDLKNSLKEEVIIVTDTKLKILFASHNIETRLLWRPMHMQPVYKDAPAYVNGVSERLFDHGLCLPSSTTLSDEQIQYVAQLINRYTAL